MNPVLFIVMTDANFAGVVDPQIQNSVSIGGFTSYITGNLTPPGSTLYISRKNADGSELRSQSKQPGYAVALMTFFGWQIPA